MKVVIDTFAWVDKSELTVTQLQALRAELTIYPRAMPGYGNEEPPGPLYMYQETDTHFGVARDWFLQKRKNLHEIEYRVCDGDKSLWTPLRFEGTPRAEQRQAVKQIYVQFKGGKLGGILRAAPGWGKTVASCQLIAELQVPTLVVVHKTFLMNQWKERIEQFLPNAKIGLCQEDVCDFRGKHIVMAMVHSLSGRKYPKEFYTWPGLVITDEAHRIGAATWSVVPAQFPARWRLGITATPRRKDGADKVFWFQIGELLFAATEQRMKPKVRRVWTEFKLVKTPKFNPNLAPWSLLITFLISNVPRNKLITEQIILAAKAKRKILVLSERLKHLKTLELMLRDLWQPDFGPKPSCGYYIGGKTEDELEDARGKDVILATYQYAAEGLDIPELDTLFLVTPYGDVEQAVGRILRPSEGKKEPIVVDVRDDLVKPFAQKGETRDRLYKRLT